MIYKTVRNCKVCSHPNRKEIEDKYLLMTGKGTESFQAFAREIESLYGIKLASLKTHFKKITRKGGVPSVPHFALGNVADAVEVSAIAEDLRKQIEMKGLSLVNVNLEKMLEKANSSGEITLEAKEVANMLKSLTSSQDSRKALDIKKAELMEKRRQFDRDFNKALYADEPATIREAEVEEPKHLN